MIVAACLAVGLTVRLLSGRSLGGLSEGRLKGEALLLALLVAQTVVPSFGLSGVNARIAFYVWLATFPLMVGIAWFNRRAPGMAVLGAGLLLNFVVIAANGGMPVFGAAVAAVSSAAHAGTIPANDFIHVIGTTATLLPWLADVIPLSGPTWLRLVASPGDLLLYAGIVAFLGGTQPMRSPAIGMHE